MKSSIPAILILLVSVSISHAQKIKIGFIGGASFANFINHKEVVQAGITDPTYLGTSGSQPIESPTMKYSTSFFKDMKTSFYSGFYIDLPISNRWTLETGLTFSQKGIDLDYSKRTTTASGGSEYLVIKRNVTHSYIVVPAVFKYYLGKKKHFYTTTGIYSAFLVNTSAKIGNYYEKQEGGNKSTTAWADLKYYTHLLDLGIALGGGYEIPVGDKWFLGIDLRMNAGGTNIAAKYDKYNYLNFSKSTKNLNFETGVRVAYTLK